MAIHLLGAALLAGLVVLRPVAAFASAAGRVCRWVAARW